MLLLRTIFLELLVCVHVIGAAVVFRRFFPRESPWLGFILPILSVLMALNFLEHYIALTNLGWLVPFTLGGAIWAIAKPGYSWNGLKLPSVLFVVTFTFVLLLKAMSPDIPCYTEGTGNMTRVLNYCLGGTLPPVDCWLPPYDYGGYYSFQQYGAAIVKRMFFLDLGTAYNLSFAFLLAWTCMAGVGVAHSITGKTWIAVATLILMLSAATGSAIFFLFFGPNGIDYGLATSITDSWDDPSRNPFSWIAAHDKYHPGLKLLPPIYTLYYSEYHADLGGAFTTLASVLASVLLFRRDRTTWPWIAVIVLPAVTIITSAWFFFINTFYCGGSLVLALLAGRRPQNWKFATIGAAVGLVLVWPTIYTISGNPATMNFFWTVPEDHTPAWIFIVQWWPVFLPWFLLCFVWHRMDLMGRWLHFAVPIIYIFIEYCTFGDHGLTLEKMWGALYGAGMVTVVPMAFMQKRWAFRIFTVLLVGAFTLCLAAPGWKKADGQLGFSGGWLKTIYWDPVDRNQFFRLQGDNFVQNDHQYKRLVQVLSRLHAATILPGKSYWGYNLAPAIIGFSENRCYIAYFHQEQQAGHGGEAEYRNDLNNKFYAGTLPAPLTFLRSNNIAAVLIWPEDEISDQQLQQFQSQIGSDYYYINCKMDGKNNAGVFMRQSDVPAPVVQQTQPPPALDLAAPPPQP